MVDVALFCIVLCVIMSFYAMTNLLYVLYGLITRLIVVGVCDTTTKEREAFSIFIPQIKTLYEYILT